MKPLLLLGTALISAFSAHAAFSMPPLPQWDDNGDHSFVRQLVPKLLGRKPSGTREVELLVDLVELHGREKVVRMLMETPEFTTHWTAMLTDHLKVQREGGRAQSPSCFDGPADVVGAPSGLGKEAAGPPSAASLAAFVRDNDDITQPYQKPFNLYDLVASSIALDNLLPAYRGYLWTLAAKPPGAGMRTESERRADVGADFDDVFLHRDMECLSCHRGTYSATGVGQRTHPLYRTLELAMFDHTNYGDDFLVDNGDYQALCAACHGADGQGDMARGIRDLDVDAVRSNLINPPTPVSPGAVQMPSYQALANDFEALNALVAALNGPFGKANLGETALLHYGVFRTDLFEQEDDELPASTFAPLGMLDECALVQAGGAWQGDLDTFFAGIADNFDLSTIDVDQQLLSGYQGLGASLDSLATWDTQNTIPGDIGFAFMVAAKITDNVWETLMGERLTIANQFARNQDQMLMHKYLTEDVFIANDWSLKELLLAIVTSGYFNRRAPGDSVADHAYSVQALFDPFNVVQRTCVDVDPEPSIAIDPVFTSGASHGGGIAGPDTLNPLPNCAFNSTGDIVHRYAPRTLLNSVGRALGWPKPKLFPGNDYPNRDLNLAVGQYLSSVDPGTKDVSFQGLLEWDDNYGRCTLGGEQGWLSRLVASVDTFNASHPTEPLLLRDVVLALKDRLLQEPVLEGDGPDDSGWVFIPPVYVNPQPAPVFGYKAPGIDPPPPPPVGSFKEPGGTDYESANETELVEILFGLSIDDPVSSASFTAVDGKPGKLQLLCGSYLKAPQFMLAGLMSNQSYTPPRLQVCNEGEACSYQQLCQSYAPSLGKVGATTLCHADSVSKPVPQVFQAVTSTVQIRRTSDSVYFARPAR